MIENRLMAAGGWEMTLRPETPLRVLRQINMLTATSAFGHVVFTPSWMPASAGEATLREASRYVGIFRAQGDMGRELSGPGLAAWMGDEDDKGKLTTTAINAERTFDDWVGRLFTTPHRANGLTQGDVETGLGNVELEFDPLITMRVIADELCAEVDAEWRTNPDFSVDFGTPGFLWPTTDDPTYVLTEHDGTVTSWGDQVDMDDYASGVLVPYADDTNYVADRDPSPPYMRPDGDPIEMERHFVPQRQKSTADKATVQAEKQRARTQDPRVEISPSVNEWDIGRLVVPGDTVWAYGPMRGLVNLANQIRHRGETIFPVAKRVYATRSPIRDGWGKYLLLPDEDRTVIDLTSWVANEDGDASLEVGAPRRTLFQAQRRGLAA